MDLRIRVRVRGSDADPNLFYDNRIWIRTETNKSEILRSISYEKGSRFADPDRVQDPLLSLLKKRNTMLELYSQILEISILITSSILTLLITSTTHFY